jgi:AraC-like DNA-binding protein
MSHATTTSQSLSPECHDSSSQGGREASLPFTCPRIAEKVIAYVLENFAEEIDLDDLAQQAGMSRFNFCRKFHRECGLPPMRWLWNFRTVLAAEFIGLDPKWSLTDIAFACGFTSSAHFSRSFRAMYNQSPSEFRKNVALKAQARAATLPSDAPVEDIFHNNTAAVLRAVSTALGNA